MKKISIVVLVLLVVLFTGCSISAGLPGLYGGWGFFFDFGNPRGDLLLEQDGSKLTGTLNVGEKEYVVDGECFKDNKLLLTLTDSEGTHFELNGVFAENKITSQDTEDSNWYAVREQ
jgi:hypothetical protein